jgi:nucleotide-binding universal stress UspA family protein
MEQWRSAVHGAVVVGVGWSGTTDAAAHWAAHECRHRHVPLVLLRVWEPFPVAGAGLWSPMPLVVSPDQQRASEQQLLDDVAVRVRAADADVPVTAHLVEGRVAATLEAAAETAALVVVGGRESDGHGHSWLGPVSTHVAGHTQAPLVVVPADGEEPGGPVVVGVDGSEVSARAVGFAFEAASRWHQPLTVVLSTSTGGTERVTGERLLEQVHESARRYLSESLAGWSQTYPDVEVATEVTLQHPYPALVEASKGAGLLVVGSHGRGAIRRAALGSVSAAVLRSATCPVAVVASG